MSAQVDPAESHMLLLEVGGQSLFSCSSPGKGSSLHLATCWAELKSIAWSEFSGDKGVKNESASRTVGPVLSRAGFHLVLVSVLNEYLLQIYFSYFRWQQEDPYLSHMKVNLGAL